MSPAQPESEHIQKAESETELYDVEYIDSLDVYKLTEGARQRFADVLGIPVSDWYRRLSEEEYAALIIVNHIDRCSADSLYPCFDTLGTFR